MCRQSVRPIRRQAWNTGILASDCPLRQGSIGRRTTPVLVIPGTSSRSNIPPANRTDCRALRISRDGINAISLAPDAAHAVWMDALYEPQHPQASSPGNGGARRLLICSSKISRLPGRRRPWRSSSDSSSALSSALEPDTGQSHQEPRSCARLTAALCDRGAVAQFALGPTGEPLFLEVCMAAGWEALCNGPVVRAPSPRLGLTSLAVR